MCVCVSVFVGALTLPLLLPGVRHKVCVNSDATVGESSDDDLKLLSDILI